MCVVATACPARETDVPVPRPTGAPEVSVDQVAEHASQFDDEIPQRQPGSDEEFAAASYLLGHLQLAGYSTFLDAVPVEDLIRSTNVVAFPPSGADPETLVVVGYGTAGRDAGNGTQVGLFLELARALQIVEPNHAVGFVALGAAAEGDEVSRGTQRLADFLAERELEPTIVEFWDVPNDEMSFKAYGQAAGELNQAAMRRDPACRGGTRCDITQELVELPDTRFLSERGLSQTVITGTPAEIAAVLLEWLSA